MLLAERLQRQQRVDPLLAGLTDPDEDPARERHRELAGEPDRLEPARGKLVGRRPVRAALRREPVGRRLEHDPHRRGDGPEQLELRACHHPGVQVREQTGLVEDEPSAALEVLERRRRSRARAAPRARPCTELRLVTEREERLATAGRRTRARDLEHLVLGHERALAAARRARERAVAADVSAERRRAG